MSAAGKAAPENGGHQHAISASAYRQKYDYVKIKVWLGENLDHYYILSRFLISRTLTVTKVPQDKVRLGTAACTPSMPATVGAAAVRCLPCRP